MDLHSNSLFSSDRGDFLLISQSSSYTFSFTCFRFLTVFLPVKFLIQVHA
jgi:hypothetical protein